MILAVAWANEHELIGHMARNAGQHGGFLCLSSALIQHSKWRIYSDYA